MQVSIREVLQLAERCFAAADFSKGTARANAESIWWTEAYRGSGLTTLHNLLDELEACDRSELSLREQSATVSVINGRTQPSIVASDPVLDLASSQAGRHGVGLACATTKANDTSLPTLGHVAYKGAQRGRVSVLMYTDGADSGTILGVPTDWKPLLAEAALAAPPAALLDVRNVVELGHHHQQNSPVTQAFFNVNTDEDTEVADERLVEWVLQRATDPVASPRADVEPGVALLCLDPCHPRHPERIQRLATQFVADQEERLTEVFTPERVQERVETLMHEGVKVERSIWEDVFEYNTGVLTPPFEGSEQGAGFGLND